MKYVHIEDLEIYKATGSHEFALEYLAREAELEYKRLDNLSDEDFIWLYLFDEIVMQGNLSTYRDLGDDYLYATYIRTCNLGFKDDGKQFTPLDKNKFLESVEDWCHANKLKVPKWGWHDKLLHWYIDSYTIFEGKPIESFTKDQLQGICDGFAEFCEVNGYTHPSMEELVFRYELSPVFGLTVEDWTSVIKAMLSDKNRETWHDGVLGMFDHIVNLEPKIAEEMSEADWAKIAEGLTVFQAKEFFKLESIRLDVSFGKYVGYDDSFYRSYLEICKQRNIQAVTEAAFFANWNMLLLLDH